MENFKNNYLWFALVLIVIAVISAIYAQGALVTKQIITLNIDGDLNVTVSNVLLPIGRWLTAVTFFAFSMAILTIIAGFVISMLDKHRLKKRN